MKKKIKISRKDYEALLERFDISNVKEKKVAGILRQYIDKPCPLCEKYFIPFDIDDEIIDKKACIECPITILLKAKQSNRLFACMSIPKEMCELKLYCNINTEIIEWHKIHSSNVFKLIAKIQKKIINKLSKYVR